MIYRLTFFALLCQLLLARPNMRGSRYGGRRGRRTKKPTTTPETPKPGPSPSPGRKIWTELLVDTPLGSIKGQRFKNGTDVFRNIPFAKPFIRFARAEVSDGWDGTLDATEDGPWCWQPFNGSHSSLVPYRPLPAKGMEEQCLVLNIWAPSQAVNSGKKLPVAVWIHGGGWHKNSGSDFHGWTQAQNGVILVTINYRMGAFGFLSHSQLKKEQGLMGGLNGVLDQVTALKWVQQNIGTFGGDPDQVTVMGESAGGLSVCYLMIMPDAKGLFKRAIIQSGSCISDSGWGLRPQKTGTLLTNLFMRSLGAKNIEGLRAMEPELLLWKGGASPEPVPSSDGKTISGDVMKTFQKGPVNGEAVLMGSNTLDSLFTDQMSPNFPYPLNDDDLKKKLAVYFSRQDYQQIMGDLAQYDPKVAYQVANGHACNTCTAQKLADILAVNQNMPVYLYRYGWNPSNDAYNGLAIHASELQQVFNDPSIDYYKTGYSPDVGYIMSNMWIRFIKGEEPWASYRPYLDKKKNIVSSGVWFDFDVSSHPVNGSYDITGVCDVMNHAGWSTMGGFCLQLKEILPGR